jgi:transcriptional regulator with XRE-family HTH domain
MTVLSEMKNARKKKRLSQAAVAAEIGRSQFWLSLVERGQAVVEEDVVRRIIAATDRAAERKTAIESAIARVNDEFDTKREALEITADTGQ